MSVVWADEIDARGDDFLGTTRLDGALLSLVYYVHMRKKRRADDGVSATWRAVGVNALLFLPPDSQPSKDALSVSSRAPFDAGDPPHAIQSSLGRVQRLTARPFSVLI
jgi:hypothetical protein